MVCKHKLGEYQSVIGITEQILSDQMDPKNIKAMYFRAFAQLKQEDFDEAVKTLNNLLELDSKHAEAVRLLAQVKKERQAYRDKEGKKFAKMFA